MFEGLMQPMHLILILFIVLIVFGPGKLPEIGTGFGKAIREFKKALNEDVNPEIQAHAEAKAADKADVSK